MTTDDLQVIEDALRTSRSVVNAYYGSEPGHEQRVLVESAYQRWMQLKDELEKIVNGQQVLTSQEAGVK